ncbi:MAG: ribulose phosphate epimerase [Myxococcota bacterium]
MLTLACGPSLFPPPQEGAGSSSGGTDDDATVGTSLPSPGPSTSTTLPATTSATGLDTGDESEGSDFIERPDGGPCFSSAEGFWLCSECDIIAQDCPQGEKCMPWANDGGSAWNATRCSPIVGDPDAVGEPCTVEVSPVSGFDSCDLASMCWEVDLQTLEGTCVAMCSGSHQEPQCPSSTTCVIANDGAIAVCLDTCSPLADDCEPSQRCLPINDAFTCYPGTGGEALAGEPCEFVNACETGLACQPSNAVSGRCDPGVFGCCTPWCDLFAPDPSAGCFDPAQQCVPWWDSPAPEGYEDLGVCRLVVP